MNILIFIKCFYITKILMLNSEYRIHKIIKEIENDNKIKKQNEYNLQDDKFLLYFLTIAD